MSSRLPIHAGARRPQVGVGLQRRRPSTTAGLELHLETARWHREPLALEAADFVELRRSIRVVRGLVAGELAIAKGTEATDAAGLPVDPLDDDASRFCVSGAFVRANKPSPPLFVAWIRLCHQAAGDLLGDPERDLFSFNDDPATGREELLELLDEVEDRLDLLAAELAADDHD